MLILQALLNSPISAKILFKLEIFERALLYHSYLLLINISINKMYCEIQCHQWQESEKAI